VPLRLHKIIPKANIDGPQQVGILPHLIYQTGRVLDNSVGW